MCVFPKDLNCGNCFFKGQFPFSCLRNCFVTMKWKSSLFIDWVDWVQGRSELLMTMFYVMVFVIRKHFYFIAFCCHVLPPTGSNVVTLCVYLVVLSLVVDHSSIVAQHDKTKFPQLLKKMIRVVSAQQPEANWPLNSLFNFQMTASSSPTKKTGNELLNCVSFLK